MGGRGAQSEIRPREFAVVNLDVIAPLVERVVEDHQLFHAQLEVHCAVVGCRSSSVIAADLAMAIDAQTEGVPPSAERGSRMTPVPASSRHQPRRRARAHDARLFRTTSSMCWRNCCWLFIYKVRARAWRRCAPSDLVSRQPPSWPFSLGRALLKYKKP